MEKINFEHGHENLDARFAALASKQERELREIVGRDLAKRIVLQGTEEVLREE